MTTNYMSERASPDIFVQFQRFANFFYLIISIVSFNADIWPAGPTANISPLGFVLFVSAIKEAVEDYNRHQADAKMNSTQVKILSGDSWTDSTWAEVDSSCPCICALLALDCSLFGTDMFPGQAWTDCQTQ